MSGNLKQKRQIVSKYLQKKVRKGTNLLQSKRRFSLKKLIKRQKANFAKINQKLVSG